MRTAVLDESAAGVIDAQGLAAVQIGPTRTGQRWHVVNLAVSSTSAEDTEARVYRGAVAPGNLIAGTYSGNQDNATLDMLLSPGERLTVQWRNGTAGAPVTVSVNGSMEVPG